MYAWRWVEKLYLSKGTAWLSQRVAKRKCTTITAAKYSVQVGSDKSMNRAACNLLHFFRGLKQKQLYIFMLFLIVNQRVYCTAYAAIR